MQYQPKSLTGKFVSPEGPENARIIVIGESPWKQEGYEERPFAGQSGKLQDRWWRDLGIRRGELRIDNLYPRVPPGREIESLSPSIIVEAIRDLQQRISRLPGPVVIAALGNYVSFALTGKGKVKAEVRNAFSLTDSSITEAEKKAGITKLRGSIYSYRDLNGRDIKVIPIIHPAAVLQTQGWEKRTFQDWKRVLFESVSGESNRPIRNHIVDPMEWQVREFTEFVEKNYKDVILSLDIETWGNQLSCCGFAISPWESLTIPLIGKQKEVFLPYIKRLCECSAPKVLQNGLYDWYWLAWDGIWINNFLWDTSLMHHAIDPIESHSLDFLASIYCPWYQYWKDEAKDAEEVIKYAFDLEALWMYNGMDCCYTRELFDLIYADLQRNGLVEFYFQHYQRMLEPLMRTMLHGIRVDKEKQKGYRKLLKIEMEEIHKELNKAAGEELFATERKTGLRDVTEEEMRLLLIEGEIVYNDKTGAPKERCIDREARQKLIDEKEFKYIIGGKNAGKMQYWKESIKKDFSGDKLLKFFYETLGLPMQYKVRKGKKGKSKSVSLDEGSIRKMTAKYPGKIGNWGNLVLAHREKKKESDYLKGVWDADGRVRCSYGLLTEAGRLKSSKNPRGTGANLQNIKR